MHFSPVIALAAFVASASALTTGHQARGHHHAIAARMAQPAGTSGNAPVVRKRASSKRCKPRSSSSAALVAPTTHTSEVKPSTTPKEALVESTTTSSKPSTTKTPEPEPTTTKTTEPTTTKQAPTTTKQTPTTTAKPTTTSTTKAAAATTTKSSSSGTSVGFLVGINTGQGTYYSTGLGACGITNKDTDYIAAASHSLFDSYPGYDGVNPNNNPLCNKKVKATYNGQSVTVAITDRCEGCAYLDLDFSPSAFKGLADYSVGRLSGMTWEWV